MIRLLLNIIFLILLTVASRSQQWQVPAFNDKQNFSTIQKSFNTFWSKYDTIPKGKGYNQFKRWEWFWEQRTFPSGKISDINFQFADRKIKSDNKQLSTGWSCIGPTSSIGGYAGLGRVNVAKSPSNENIIFIGAASGGLWKSTDNGQTWTTNTDNFASLGISDMLIQPNNPNIMYLATGDADASSTYSIGVLKTTNGGTSWNNTGLTFKTSQMKRIYKLVMHPSNFNIIYAVGNNGVDKTTNGGTTWTNILSGSFFDIKLKPQNPQTVYVCGTGFHVSTDAGSSWETISTGWPSTNVSRAAIDISPAAPDNVYALMSNSEYGFGGFYLSTNSGNTWVNKSNSPNLLGWTPTGTDVGGQGWYDLCIAVSPIDENLVYIGGINIWVSENAGSSWRIESTWYPSNNMALIHADHHALWFIPGSTTLYSSNDGGIYRKRMNNNWEWLGSGLKITQFYRLGCSSTDSALIIAGSQDNGTKLKYSAGFKDLKGGDGMECLIDSKNNQIMYATMPFGALSRSELSGEGFINIKPTTAKGNWVTPFVANPMNNDIIYAAYEDVYKSTNKGNNWVKISDFRLSSNKSLDFIAVSETDTNVIYTGQGNGIFKKTTNGGQTWSDIQKPINLWITSIAIHPENPRKFIITFSGYEATQRVYQSSDGGNSWQNITGNLPAIPVNTVIYEKNTPNRSYVGTDIGVYYKDDNQNVWIDYSDNLPNVVINELEINYPSKMLRAATYGRGLWQCPFAKVIIKPDFHGDTIACSLSQSKYIAKSFTGLSSKWFVTGGTIIGLSTGDTISVNWQDKGTGTVKLIQELNEYKDSVTKKISIIELPKSVIIGNDTVCHNSVSSYSAIGNNINYKWILSGGDIIGSDTSSDVNVKWTNNSAGTVELIVNAYNSNCFDTTYKKVKINKLEKVTVNGANSVCPGIEYVYFINNPNKYNLIKKVYNAIATVELNDSLRIIWDKRQTGQIRIIYRDAITSCEDTLRHNVIIQSIPEATLTGNLTTCLNSEENYTSANSYCSYKWKTVGGQIIGTDTSNSVTIKWINEGEQTLRLVKTDRITGCFLDTNYTIKVKSFSDIKIEGKDSVCLNEELQIGLNNSQGLKIKWLVTGGLIIGSSVDSNLLVRWNTTGRGIVKALLNDTTLGCKDSIIKFVLINNKPEIAINGLFTVCQSCEEKYFAQIRGMNNYWSVSGGNIIGLNTLDSVVVKWNDSLNLSIKLIQTNKKTNCIDSISKVITVASNNNAIIEGDKITCLDTNSNYFTSSSSKYSNDWSVDKGNITENFNNHIVVNWIQSGLGTVKLIRTKNDNKQSDTAELKVIVNKTPHKPEIYRNNYSLVSSSDSNNHWYLDGVEIAGANQKIYTPEAEGIYNLTIMENDCISELSDDYIFRFSSVNEQQSCNLMVTASSDNQIISLSFSRNCGFVKSINIYNTIGQEMTSRILYQDDSFARIECKLNPGAYFCVVRFDKLIETIIFIIN